MNTPYLHDLAVECLNGRNSVHEIVKELASVLPAEVPVGHECDSAALKIVIGHLAFLTGDSLGPSDEALEEFCYGPTPS